MKIVLFPTTVSKPTARTKRLSMEEKHKHLPIVISFAVGLSIAYETSATLVQGNIAFSTF